MGGEIQKKSLAVIKKGGRLITTVAPENIEEAKVKGISVEGFMAQSLPKDLADIAALIDEGKVKSIVEKIFPLQEAAEAQKLSEEGHTKGKIVLKVI